MNVYLVRHGCTEFNNANVCQGPEVTLCAQGVAEAKLIAFRLSQEKAKIDKIFSSGMPRARQTAAIIGQALKVPVKIWADLREIKRPRALEGKQYADPISLEIRQAITAHQDDKNWHHSDEENYFDQRDRLNGVLAKLELMKEENIILVSHGIAIKLLICAVIFGKSLSPARFAQFHRRVFINNTGITHLNYDPQEGWFVKQINDTTHLQTATRARESSSD